MAVLGFGALCLFGSYCIAAGLYFFWLTSVFGGGFNRERFLPLIPLAIGVGAIWVAFANSPLSVTVQVQP